MSRRTVGRSGRAVGESSRPDPEVAAVILDRAPVGIAVISPAGRVAWANPAYYRLLGHDATVLGRSFREFSGGANHWPREVVEAIDRILRGNSPPGIPSIRAQVVRPGGPLHVDIDVLSLPGGAGGAPQAILLVRDVSDRVGDELRARLFYESFRTSTNPMQLTDAAGVMVDVNPAFERIYGYSRAECIGRKPNLVRSQRTPPELYDQMWADLADPARGYWSGEIINRDRQGRERPVLLSITAIRPPGGRPTHYLGVAVDLSEQRSWELRAAHADKLASVGQLAAGVAHEINTPLANVMLVAESLRRRSSDPWVLARLDTMTGQVEVAARIVRSLLDFARRTEPRVAALDLADVAKETVAFLRGKQSADVEIEEVYAPGGVRVLGDRGQLMQVLTNILNNAYDAMGGKGRIRISVRRQGLRAEVEIVDNGAGIPPEALPHIFEPFFTTKPEGQGTGLGLAICHGIVQSHHGSITARNVPGAGAAFLVSLPLLDESPPTA